MAYMNQDRKAQLAPAIKQVCKKYNAKVSIAVRHHSTLIVTIASSPIDFIKNYNDTNKDAHRYEPITDTYHRVNEYYIDSNFTDTARDFLMELRQAANTLNHNNSNLMIDYFDVGYYVDIKIGAYDKPYLLLS
jgi:hypothetical protein